MGRRLKNWGIFSVYIEGEEESEEMQEQKQISPEEIKKQLEAKFSGTLENELMRKIFNAVFEFRTSKKGA
jgi:hypothetical protein